MIHDIVTSSPSDSEQLEAIPFVTNISLGGPIDVPASMLPPVVPEEPSFFPLSSEGPAAAEQPVDSPSDTLSTPLGAAEASPADTAQSGVGIAAETPAAPSAHADADIAVAPERTEPSNLTDDHPAPETVGSEETEEEATGENEEMENYDEMEDAEEDEEGTVSIGLSLNSNVRVTCGMGFQMLLTMEHVAS